MEIKKVENIGMSSGKDYDFYCGCPAFIADENSLSVCINNGTDFGVVALPIEGIRAEITEILNPAFSLFKMGSQGAVYRVVAGAKGYLANVTYDGIELYSEEDGSTYYPFDEAYGELEELADNFDISVEDLLQALGF